MSQVRIVTDSTADIPASLRQQLGIEMVPLKVLFGQEAFRDVIDIAPAQFYDRMAATSALPTTSQPSPAEFLGTYERLLAEGDGPIISIHLASVLSGTFQSAQIAKSMLEGPNDVTVVDSRSASFGIGMQVVAAAEAARAGKSKEEILRVIDSVREGTALYFLVDTLEYLQKGGRIGKAAAMLGALLNIKPILSLTEAGEVHAVDKVRGQKKAMNRIIELLTPRFGQQPVQAVFAYTTGEATAHELEALIRQHFDVRAAQYTHIGPVIGTHVGPGTVAVFLAPA